MIKLCVSTVNIFKYSIDFYCEMYVYMNKFHPNVVLLSNGCFYLFIYVIVIAF